MQVVLYHNPRSFRRPGWILEVGKPGFTMVLFLGHVKPTRRRVRVLAKHVREYHKGARHYDGVGS